MSDLKQLLAAVASSHDRHFGHTILNERLRDLQHQVAELVHAPDPEGRGREVGDVLWALLQLSTELGVDPGRAVEATIAQLDGERAKGGLKVALIGTSANPITYGHVTMGLELLALTDVDEVWYWIPGRHPWGKPLMPGEHRAEMVRLATAAYPRLKVCDFDIVHGERIYAESMETAHLLEHHLMPAFPGNRFVWVMGSDVAQSFDTWTGSEWMAANLDVVVIHRLGYAFDPAGGNLDAPRHRYLKDGIVTSNISSSLVRERGKAYDPERVRALVAPTVWDYLEEHRLLDESVFSQTG